MFKSIWNLIVKACKAIKDVVTRKYVNNFSTDVVEGTTLVDTNVAFSWIKWFSGTYRFGKDQESQLKKLHSKANRLNIGKNVLIGAGVGFLTLGVIGGDIAMACYLGAVLFYGVSYIALSFLEAMSFNF